MMKALAFSAIPLYLFGGYYRPLLFAGFAAQFVYLFARGIHLERLPLVGLHDTLAFLASSIVAFSLPFYQIVKEKSEFRWMVAVGAFFFSVMSVISPPHEMPLPPVLKTYWFEFHVALSFFSYALFGIGAALGALFLRYPDTIAFEKRQYKAILLGYLLFSLSMIFGGVWAYLAWGTYWLWTPKELWTSILWLFYSLYLHTRFMKQWYGKRSAIIGMVGFAVVLFTYLGVGLLMKSSHAF
jgi:ABC-type transport system involved in cytochrome c biogenesis permease subunit